MESNHLSQTLLAGPRAYLLVWAAGGVAALALTPLPTHAPQTSSSTRSGTPDCSTANPLLQCSESCASPSAAPAGDGAPTLLHRLLIAPWQAPWAALQGAARGFPQPLSSPLFLVPAGLLTVLVVLQPLALLAPPPRSLWPRALRSAASTLAGLHLLALGAREGEEPRRSGSRGGSRLLSLAAGVAGFTLLALGSAPLAPWLPALDAAPSAAAPVGATPEGYWGAAGTWLGAGTKVLKEHTLAGLHEAGKYAKTAEAGLGLAGVPFPLAATLEGAKTLMGGEPHSTGPEPMTAAELEAVVREVTWGDLARHAPALLGAAGGCLGLLAIAVLQGKGRGSA